MASEPIKKSKDGTYKFRVHLGFDAKGKRIQKYRSGFKTKKEARDKYVELLHQREDYIVKKEESITFEEYTKQIFIPWYKSKVKIQTFENRLNVINTYFPFFFKFNVNEIDPIHVQKWQLKLSKKFKPSYVRGVQGMFSMAMDRAVVLGLCDHNPAKVVGNVKKQKTTLKFWTKSEFELVMSYIDVADYYNYYIYVSLWLLFMTGIRIGEASALSWDDIDFEVGTLNIDKTLHYKNQQDYSFGVPKTKASIRVIALDNDTLELLKKWKDVQTNAISKSKFVLSYNGCPSRRGTFARVIKSYAKLANIHPIRTHDFRHSHASLLIQLGENPLIIRDRLGHEDVETTLGTYGHLYPNSNFEVATKLNGIINVYTNESTVIPNKNQFTASVLRNVQ